MGSTIELHAADGHSLSAYRAGPEAAPQGLVVIQEIFGVNHHMRAVCDEFAAQGYAVIAPALFDRAQRGIELGYGPDDRKVGIELRAQVPDAGAMADVEAAAKALGGTPLGIVGYCWGGTIAWWGATRTAVFQAAVGWYGGGIAKTRTEHPSCKVQLHFGELDHGIPLTDVETIREAQPEVEIFIYEGAQHGFGCTERDSYKRDARDLAQQRTLEFLGRNVRVAALALCLLASATPAFAQGIIDEWKTVVPPPPPSLTKVTIDPATSALLVLDLAEQTCNTHDRPRCVAMLPRVAQLLEHARAKKWTVIYTLGAASKPADILKPIAMLGSEPIVTAPPDKFIGTNLETLLKERGIKTVVTVGAASEGAVMHTAATAAFRGFNVVVPVDGMASGSLYAEQYVTWDLVNAPRLGDKIKLSAIALID